MREWWDRTFPSFAHWNAATFMLLPVVILMMACIAYGVGKVVILNDPFLEGSAD